MTKLYQQKPFKSVFTLKYVDGQLEVWWAGPVQNMVKYGDGKV